MSTPDQFFKIRPDYMPGVVNSGDDQAIRASRLAKGPQSQRDFQKILDKDDDRHSKDDNRIAKREGRVAKKESSKEDEAEALAKRGGDPQIDPRSNQTPALGDESKVAPELGSEMTAASPESAWAKGYIKGSGEKDSLMMLIGKGAAEDSAEAIAQAKEAMMLAKERGETHGALSAEKSSPNDLFRSMAAKGKKTLPEDGSDRAIAANALQVGPSSRSIPHNFAAEGVNSAQRAAEMQLLIERIADQISVVSMGSKNDTTITLTNVGDLSGATVTVSTYSTAPGQINIAFENLTQKGMQMLDLLDRSLLKQALDQKGFVVHNMIMSPLERQGPENVFQQKEGRGFSDQQLAEDGGQQQKKNQRQNERDA